MFKCNCPHEVRAYCSEPECPHYSPPDKICPVTKGDHIPMQSALADAIGCIRCGQWLGKIQ